MMTLVATTCVRLRCANRTYAGSYKAGLGIEAALEEITAGSGKYYDPEVVAACVRLFREKGFSLAY